MESNEKPERRTGRIILLACIIVAFSPLIWFGYRHSENAALSVSWRANGSPGLVCGRLVDSQGRPIMNAWVELDNDSGGTHAITDGDGKFQEYSHEVISVQIRPFEELTLRRFIPVQTSDGLWLDIVLKDGSRTP